jgi:hypothetical protein
MGENENFRENFHKIHLGAKIFCENKYFCKNFHDNRIFLQILLQNFCNLFSAKANKNFSRKYENENFVSTLRSNGAA